METHQSQQTLHLIAARSLLLWRGAPCMPLLASFLLCISECLHAGGVSQSCAAGALSQHGMLLSKPNATKQHCRVLSASALHAAQQRGRHSQSLLFTAACCSARALPGTACCCGPASVRRCLDSVTAETLFHAALAPPGSSSRGCKQHLCPASSCTSLWLLLCRCAREGLFACLLCNPTAGCLPAGVGPQRDAVFFPQRSALVSRASSQPCWRAVLWLIVGAHPSVELRPGVVCLCAGPVLSCWPLCPDGAPTRSSTRASSAPLPPANSCR